MIEVPAGIDVALLFADFMYIAAPFMGVGLIISTGYLIIKIIKNRGMSR